MFDETIQEIKKFGPDGFLENLHALLMDDTAVLATSREALHTKFSCLIESVQGLERKIHPTKFQYIVSDGNDEEPFLFGEIIVEKTFQKVHISWYKNKLFHSSDQISSV